MCRTLLAAMAAFLIFTSVPGLAQSDEDIDRITRYRQSIMTIVGANMGPLADMAKGTVEWDAAAVARYSADLAAAANLDIIRGFPAGSGTRQTRAKAGIWNNIDDFRKRLDEFGAAAGELAQVAAGGERKPTMEALGALGKSCKGCHDEYKSKDLLN
jgi:cytochrome c556